MTTEAYGDDLVSLDPIEETVASWCVLTAVHLTIESSRRRSHLGDANQASLLNSDVPICSFFSLRSASASSCRVLLGESACSGDQGLERSTSWVSSGAQPRPGSVWS